MSVPLIDSELLLQKFPGKGGWTYAEVPLKENLNRSNFGWVKVKGNIDGFEIENYSLAPFKGGKLFLPVRAEIRKKIKKQAGDYIKVRLLPDHSVFAVPQEIVDCLNLEPEVYQKFIKLSLSDQKQYVKWIYSAKKEDTKAARINQLMNSILNMKSK